MWTGYTVDFTNTSHLFGYNHMLARITPCEQAAYAADAQAMLAANKTCVPAHPAANGHPCTMLYLPTCRVYVISDGHYGEASRL
jgi:hypothetical protein